ncbi:hypothetical protein LEP1GSC125_2385 [Leptospira mayottensis 200901122]|uniref:Uncharacterized protein n=1 Tax=Leptospira mayottensis 200901122 TaxID=1193010 RepID=A0AA87SX23_9LEPT|nr:hypothetical protein LEP1GSC125_2385 [Leptospira mayottensis 200901122]
MGQALRITSDVIKSFRKDFKHFVLAAGLGDFRLFIIKCIN